jgi:hypothetical protein
MSTADRKARKREGRPFTRERKRPTRAPGRPRGLGLTTGAEILTSLVVHGRP